MRVIGAFSLINITSRDQITMFNMLFIPNRCRIKSSLFKSAFINEEVINMTISSAKNRNREVWKLYIEVALRETNYTNDSNVA